jgi:predicted kinase
MEPRIVPSTPTMILVMGHAGSGKTSVAREILRRVVCVYLDNNFIADAFFPSTRNSPEYIELRPRLYSALYRITEENLRIGNSVVLDVPHVREVQDRQWHRLIQGLTARTASRLLIIKCRCSEDALRDRLLRRGEERDRWKLENWQQFLREQPLDVDVPFDHLDLITDRDEHAGARAVAYILWQIA